MPHEAHKRRMVIPTELNAKHGAVEEDVFRHGGDARNVRDSVYDFANAANGHIQSARALFEEKPVPSEAMPVFLSAVSDYSDASLHRVNIDASARCLSSST